MAGRKPLPVGTLVRANVSTRSWAATVYGAILAYEKPYYRIAIYTTNARQTFVADLTSVLVRRNELEILPPDFDMKAVHQILQRIIAAVPMRAYKDKDYQTVVAMIGSRLNNCRVHLERHMGTHVPTLVEWSKTTFRPVPSDFRNHSRNGWLAP